MERSKVHLWRLILTIVFLLFWEGLTGGIYAGFSPIDPFYTSSPSRIAKELYKLFFSGSVIKDIYITLTEAISGLLIGILSGVSVGLLFAYSKRISDIFEPLMSAFNSLPRPVLAPLTVFWFGIGFLSKVFLSWSIVFFVIFYNTYLGVKSIEPEILNVLRVMGANRLQMLRIVILPSVASWIFAGLRLSVSYALIGAIIGEFVGATGGLGYQMIYAEGLLLTDRLYALVFLVGFIGLGMVELAKLVERRALRWRPEVYL